ncbi:MAG: TerC/Alx family metal homeostasis membrane protein [Gemmatimonadales bacterium]|jgi:tellurite resistance protein TerC
MRTSPWFWIGFHALLLGVLALDLGVFHRRARAVSAREAAIWTAVWVALALAFAGAIAAIEGTPQMLTFLTGYFIEESLSIDNIFVIVLVFASFRIPAEYQHRVLFWGIFGALAMRGAAIATGGFLLDRFAWATYIFGAVVLLTAVRLVVRRDEGVGRLRGPLMRGVQRVLPVSDTFDGQRFLTRDRVTGRRVATPLLMALVVVECMDLLFAADSIPAIFAITRDTFLVYTSNILAIAGLRSLYFLLADAVRRFRYLHYGLAVILTFVGLKMILSGVVTVPTVASLGVVAVVMAAAIGLSVLTPESGGGASGAPPAPGH